MTIRFGLTLTHEKIHHWHVQHKFSHEVILVSRRTESLARHSPAAASANAVPAEVNTLKEENGMMKSRIVDLEIMLSHSKETI